MARRRRIDRALFAVVMEAYVHGVSTRKVDDLVQNLGVGTGISRSEVSRICGELDTDLKAFRERSLAHVQFPAPEWSRRLRTTQPPVCSEVTAAAPDGPSWLRADADGPWRTWAGNGQADGTSAPPESDRHLTALSAPAHSHPPAHRAAKLPRTYSSGSTEMSTAVSQPAADRA